LNTQGEFQNNKISEVVLRIYFKESFDSEQINNLKSLVIEPLRDFKNIKPINSFNFQISGTKPSVELFSGFQISNSKGQNITFNSNNITFKQIGKYSTLVNFIESFNFFCNDLKDKYSTMVVDSIELIKINLFDFNEQSGQLIDSVKHICNIKSKDFFFLDGGSLNIMFQKKVNEISYLMRMAQNKIDSKVLSLTINSKRKINTELKDIFPLLNSLQEQNSQINKIFEESLTESFKNQLR